MVSPCSFSFSRSGSVPEKSDVPHSPFKGEIWPLENDSVPEKEGPSTFACKSKNACGRIGIF